MPHNNDNRFEGKVALVTGASSGIGRATAARLASEGAHVAVTARREDKIKALVSDIESAGGTAHAIAADLTKEDDRRRLVDDTVGHFGGLDVLVNAAGVIAYGTIEDTSLEDWQKMYEVSPIRKNGLESKRNRIRHVGRGGH